MPDVEAVAIATPVRFHYEVAKAALQAGKHVLIEKPMTENSRQARELIDLAADGKLTLMVDHTFLFTGAVEKIREIVCRGDLGESYYVDSVRVNLGLFQSDVDVIWDLAPHDLSIVGHVFNIKPKVVRAIGRNHAGHSMVDVAYLHVDYEGRVSAAFHVNWLSPTKIRRMIFAGSKRMIVWDDLEATEKIRVYDKGVELQQVGEEDKRRIRVDYRTGDAWLPRLDTTEALRKMAGHFVDCYRNGKRPICSGEDGLEVVKVLEASRMSLQNGCRAVSLDGEDPSLM
jgi:predicted dehydrogenase